MKKQKENRSPNLNLAQSNFRMERKEGDFQTSLLHFQYQNDRLVTADPYLSTYYQ